MEREKKKLASLLMWAVLATLLSQNFVVPVTSSVRVADQKNYYSPDPHAGGSPTSPSHGSGGSYGSTPPAHGTPSHRGRGRHGSRPPSNCGNPPSGGHNNPTPTPPTGGYYPYPPSSGGSTPSTPPVISTPPTIITPPTTPIIIPGTPPSIPTPPFDPNSPFPGTCDFWSTHPGLIYGLFGWWGTVGGALGVGSIPGFGSNMSLQQALSNTRTDGLGELYREGTASLLNSMVNKRFPYTTKQVRDSFMASLGSNKAAASQARLFRLANEGRLKH